MYCARSSLSFSATVTSLQTSSPLSATRPTLHDLRHSHAVHLIAAGQHVKVVSERLGHASTAFTMDRYGHVMPNLQSDAASAVAALVDG
ncbi:MAG TPA: tyrosine-type recombinase/integrase [Acidimicrobiia bacterium]